MTPITVVVGVERGTDHLGQSAMLRDELCARAMRCVLLVESPDASTDHTRSACAALAAAGISTVVATGSAQAPSVVAGLPRALVALPSAAATIDDIEARGWIPPAAVYTEEELDRVTARLHDLGYA